MWTDTYLILAEQEFDNVFEDIFEEKIINKIFSDHEILIEREDFIAAIASHDENIAQASWLFDPEALRDLFLEHILKPK